MPPRPVRDYMDQKVPVTPLIGPPAPNWKTSWNRLARQTYIVLPNQLDRARVNRNKFLQAVK